MFTRDSFRKIMSLRAFMEKDFLDNLQYDYWLYVSESKSLNLDILCFAIREDFEEIDNYIKELELISTNDLKNILNKLISQNPTYTDCDFLTAINFSATL